MARKKNPRVARLENQIERLKLLVNVMKDEEIQLNELTNDGYGVILDNDKNFSIVKLKFNPITKKSIVDAVEYTTDTYAKLIYELQKRFTNSSYDLLKLKQGEKNAKS